MGTSGGQTSNSDETYDGRIDAYGKVLITGRAVFASGLAGISLSGEVKEGVLQATGLMGRRQCTLTFRRQ